MLNLEDKGHKILINERAQVNKRKKLNNLRYFRIEKMNKGRGLHYCLIAKE